MNFFFCSAKKESIHCYFIWKQMKQPCCATHEFVDYFFSLHTILFRCNILYAFTVANLFMCPCLVFTHVQDIVICRLKGIIHANAKVEIFERKRKKQLWTLWLWFPNRTLWAYDGSIFFVLETTTKIVFKGTHEIYIFFSGCQPLFINVLFFSVLPGCWHHRTIVIFKVLQFLLWQQLKKPKANFERIAKP